MGNGPRLHLTRRPGTPPGRAMSLWLVCSDFDAAYRTIGARLPLAPPEVTFFGSIVFSVSDPDGHGLTFAASAKDF
jgi:hypothetical protein